MTNRTLTRADLVDAVHDDLGLPRQGCVELVEDVLELISDELVAGNTVKLSAFGTFSVRDKGGRVGRNPKTGEEVPIAPRRVLVFKPSPVLRDRVDQGMEGEGAPAAEVA